MGAMAAKVVWTSVIWDCVNTGFLHSEGRGHPAPLSKSNATFPGKSANASLEDPVAELLGVRHRTACVLRDRLSYLSRPAGARRVVSVPPCAVLARQVDCYTLKLAVAKHLCSRLQLQLERHMSGSWFDRARSLSVRWIASFVAIFILMVGTGLGDTVAAQSPDSRTVPTSSFVASSPTWSHAPVSGGSFFGALPSSPSSGVFSSTARLSQHCSLWRGPLTGRTLPAASR